jgi:hypothetical protein
MSARLLILALEGETDVVLVRKRTRRLAELVGFEPQDQTRITTAVSEIARNAFEYAGGGRVDFRLSGRRRPAAIRDRRHRSWSRHCRSRCDPRRLAAIGHRNGNWADRRAAADG